MADSTSVENIHVINLRTNKGTISNPRGEFQIYTEVNDSLLFSSIQYYNRTLVLTEDILKGGNLEVLLYSEANELKQVDLSDFKLSGYLHNDLANIKYFDREKYGIPYPEKKLTQTELKLYTATEGIDNMWNYLFILVGAPMPLDPLLNEINGRTKYLKKINEREKLQLRVQEGINVFGRKFFVEELNIPDPEIENFVYYCADFEEFQTLLNSRNKLDLIEFYQEHSENFKLLRQ